jgi:hypothetical protein
MRMMVGRRDATDRGGVDEQDEEEVVFRESDHSGNDWVMLTTSAEKQALIASISSVRCVKKFDED